MWREVCGTKECEENGKDDDDLERNFVNWFGPRVPCVWSCFPLDPGRWTLEEMRNPLPLIVVIP